MTEKDKLIERLWSLHRRGLSYASSKPAVNLLLADMAEGLRDAATALNNESKPVENGHG